MAQIVQYDKIYQHNKTNRYSKNYQYEKVINMTRFSKAKFKALLEIYLNFSSKTPLFRGLPRRFYRLQ